MRNVGIEEEATTDAFAVRGGVCVAATEHG
jgi:hypothetical protein